MIQVRPTESGLALPNDQDASGRSLGEAELARLADVIELGTLTSTKGPQVPELEQRFAALLGTSAAVACSSGHRRHPRRDRRDRPGAGRRDHHHADHRHGGAHADPLPGRDPGLRRRRPAHRQRHRGDHRGPALGPHRGDRRDPPVRQPVRHRRDPRRSATRTASRSSRTARRRSSPAATAAWSAPSARSAASAPAGQAHHHRRGRHRRHRRPGVHAAGSACSSTRPGATARTNPDHEFLALNSRMTELQGAVAVAQLDKLEAGIAQRIDDGGPLDRATLAGVPGITPPSCATTTSRPGGSTRSWWTPT